MNVIPINTAQERHLLAIKTYEDIKTRQANKKRLEGELNGMKIDYSTRKLRKQVQGRRY